MKKILMIFAVAGCLVACDGGNGGKDSVESEKDSLRSVIEQKDNEINDLMGTFNEIQQGFDLINEAEGRVNMLKGNAERNNMAENIRENMEFIQQTLAENKRKIAELENKLNSSSINSSKLKEAVNRLMGQLKEKDEEIELLRRELAEKNVMIAALDSTVNVLKDENAEIRRDRDVSDEIARNQDVQLNTAWYVFGTSKELKEQGILQKGEVLKGEYNKNYFTKIDIRTTNQIRLYSKGAKVLTNHPNGTYALEKDDKGELTLKITNAKEFWSVSKYLVIQVD